MLSSKLKLVGVMNGLVIILALTALPQPADAGLSADAHRDRLAQPEAAYDFCFYLTTASVPPDQRDRLAQVAAFVTASVSRQSKSVRLAGVSCDRRSMRLAAG